MRIRHPLRWLLLAVLAVVLLPTLVLSFIERAPLADACLVIAGITYYCVRHNKKPVQPVPPIAYTAPPVTSFPPEADTDADEHIATVTDLRSRILKDPRSGARDIWGNR
jgi:hypothetical protein